MTPQPNIDAVVEAIENVINGLVPGAVCDGDWLITSNGIRLSIKGIASEAAAAAVEALQLTEEIYPPEVWQRAIPGVVTNHRLVSPWVREEQP